MFTGLVTDVGRVVAASEGDKLRRFRIESGYDPAGISLGASIACSGPCLTVVAFGGAPGGSWFEVDAAAETLARTNVGAWNEGTRVNLERSLRIGDELGGHIVSGHVDGLAEMVAREEVTPDSQWGPTAKFTLRAPQSLKRFVAEKGSVTLDGTSLTVNEVEDDLFTVLIIPHTLAVTTWGDRRAGDLLNFEVDLMARYAARLAETSMPRA